MRKIKVSITRRVCISVYHCIAPQADKQRMIIFKITRWNAEILFYLCIRRLKSNKHTDSSFPICIWRREYPQTEFS